MAESFIGTYKLRSFDASFDGGDWKILFGEMPNGYAVITPTRFIAVLSAASRNPGRGLEERAALVDSMCAYSGIYRIEGQKFITSVDVSWTETWRGTDQGRTWAIEGDRLTLLTDAAPSPWNSSQTAIFRVVWDRVE